MPHATHRAAGGAVLRPVLPQRSFPARRRWLLLPGLGQTGAYWTPVARWLAADGTALLAADMPLLSAACTAPRGSYDRLVELAGLLADAAARHGARAVVGHSAGAPAALLSAGATPGSGLRAAMLVDPVPEHLGMTRTTPGPEPRTWCPATPTRRTRWRSCGVCIRSPRPPRCAPSRARARAGGGLRPCPPAHRGPSCWPRNGPAPSAHSSTRPGAPCWY
ncbi:alpha/beta fold hydrolase [Streptomyces sp. Ac-502]|uniref:alpha/beta fold hydrolase n=1 Tax=Streptomyces sp. Ac-502 TaxID=3342801 RepID=UPI003862311D